jgi:hypothetical protein
MNALKLNAYLFEKMVIELPTFPGKRGKHLMMIKVNYKTTLYLSEKMPDRGALRLQVFAKSRGRRNQPNLRFDASIVGIFKMLDKTKSFRSLTKKVAAPILYDILLDHTSWIFEHAIVKGFHLPAKMDK